jgi:hypothetical protein
MSLWACEPPHEHRTAPVEESKAPPPYLPFAVHQDVQLSVSAPEPAAVSDPSLTLDSVSGGGGGGEAASVCLAFSWEARDGGDSVPASNLARVRSPCSA